MFCVLLQHINVIHNCDFKTISHFYHEYGKKHKQYTAVLLLYSQESLFLEWREVNFFIGKFIFDNWVIINDFFISLYNDNNLKGKMSLLTFFKKMLILHIWLNKYTM